MEIMNKRDQRGGQRKTPGQKSEQRKALKKTRGRRQKKSVKGDPAGAGEEATYRAVKEETH